MSITVNDVILRAQDHLANYSTGQVNTDMKIRGVDAAINYLKNVISFPFDTKKYRFYYSADNFYYNCPSDFQEAQGLYYDDATKNFPQQGMKWDYRPDEEILVKTGQFPTVGNYWSHTTVNGTHQILMLGQNQQNGQVLETFNTVLWTPSGDANTATTDTTTYYLGTASEKFNITYSTGVATLTSPTVYWNFTSLVQYQGNINLYLYMPSTSVTSVTFNFQSSSGNSYSMTATAQADGTAWQLNQWNKLTFPISSATITGTPVLTNINQLSISINVPNTFGSVAGFRVDNLYTVYPDYMDLIYMSNTKATDGITGASKSIITATTDILPYDNDWIEPIALYTALYAMPQLNSDLNFMSMYRANFTDILKVWSRRSPRRRTENNRPRTRMGRN